MQIRAPRGTLRDVGIILKHQGAVVARAHVARVGMKTQTLILRANGRMPPPGDYMVTGSVDGGSLIWQDQRVG